MSLDKTGTGDIGEDKPRPPHPAQAGSEEITPRQALAEARSRAQHAQEMMAGPPAYRAHTGGQADGGTSSQERGRTGAGAGVGNQEQAQTPHTSDKAPFTRPGTGAEERPNAVGTASLDSPRLSGPAGEASRMPADSGRRGDGIPAGSRELAGVDVGRALAEARSRARYAQDVMAGPPVYREDPAGPDRSHGGARTSEVISRGRAPDSGRRQPETPGPGLPSRRDATGTPDTEAPERAVGDGRTSDARQPREQNGASRDNSTDIRRGSDAVAAGTAQRAGSGSVSDTYGQHEPRTPGDLTGTATHPEGPPGTGQTARHQEASTGLLTEGQGEAPARLEVTPQLGDAAGHNAKARLEGTSEEGKYEGVSWITLPPEARTLGDTTPTGIGLKPDGDQLLDMENGKRSRTDRLLGILTERADDVRDASSAVGAALEADFRPVPGSSGQIVGHQPSVQLAHQAGVGESDPIGATVLTLVGLVAGLRYVTEHGRKHRHD